MARTNHRRNAGEADVLVFCFHAVSDDWPADFAVSASMLRRQLEHFVGSGYRGATFTEAVATPAAEKTIVVTFDDAYRSVVEQAYPVLSALGLPGTVFAPTGLADGERRSWEGVDRWLDGPWADELAGATWAQLRELAQAGCEIGSHTRSHPRLTAVDDASLAAELEGSRADCERHLEVPCRSIAYPFGDVDTRVARAAHEAGYIAGASLSQRFDGPGAAPDPMRWPRLCVANGESPLRVRAKAGLYRHPRAWNLVHRARERVGGGASAPPDAA